MKAIRSVKHRLPLLNPCLLFPIIFLSVMCLEMASERICSIIFLEAEGRLTGLYSLLVLLEDGVTFALFQSSGISSDHYDLSKMVSHAAFLTLSLHTGHVSILLYEKPVPASTLSIHFIFVVELN